MIGSRKDKRRCSGEGGFHWQTIREKEIRLRKSRGKQRPEEYGLFFFETRQSSVVGSPYLDYLIKLFLALFHQIYG
jgi:hypothetical protein